MVLYGFLLYLFVQLIFAKTFKAFQDCGAGIWSNSLKNKIAGKKEQKGNNDATALIVLRRITLKQKRMAKYSKQNYMIDKINSF